MSGTILTPNAIWNNFYIPEKLGAEIFNERKVDGVIFEDVHIEGRKIGEETVNIYALLARKKKDVEGPAILLLQNFHNSLRLPAKLFCILSNFANIFSSNFTIGSTI